MVVQEVRRQFADGKIMSGEKQPDHGPVIDICTAASLRELVTPALLAVLTPVIIGFGIGFTALGAFLVGVILVGQLMANYLSNAGGAWDNAKKYIEDGNEGGKGSDSYRAAVIADTVGDPFKDTAGPALNPLIKVMNLVSLLVLPAIIGLTTIKEVTPGNYTATPNGTSLAIAGVALVVLIGAVAFSKRKKEAFGGTTSSSPPPPPSTDPSTPALRQGPGSGRGAVASGSVAGHRDRRRSRSRRAGSHSGRPRRAPRQEPPAGSRRPAPLPRPRSADCGSAALRRRGHLRRGASSSRRDRGGHPAE